MKNFKWLLLSLTFLFVAPSAFACIATTTATPTIAVPTTNKISFKQKIKLFKDFLFKKSENAPMPKSTGYFWGSAISILVALFFFKRSDDLAKAAAAKGQGNFTPSFAGVAEGLSGFLLALLGIILFIIFLVKLKKEKAKKQNTEGSSSPVSLLTLQK